MSDVEKTPLDIAYDDGIRSIGSRTPITSLLHEMCDAWSYDDGVYAVLMKPKFSLEVLKAAIVPSIVQIVEINPDSLKALFLTKTLVDYDPFAKMIEAHRARQAEWKERDGAEFNALFHAVGMAGEIGEACNVVKKLERAKITSIGSTSDVDQLAEELADGLAYMFLLVDAYHIDLWEAYRAKFNVVSQKLGFKTRL